MWLVTTNLPFLLRLWSGPQLLSGINLEATCKQLIIQYRIFLVLLFSSSVPQFHVAISFLIGACTVLPVMPLGLQQRITIVSVFIITNYLAASWNICASTPSFVCIGTVFSLWPAVVWGRWSVCLPQGRQPSWQGVSRFYSAPYPTARM